MYGIHAGDILCTEEIAQLTSDSFVTVTFSLDDLNIDFDVFESPIDDILADLEKGFAAVR